MAEENARAVAKQADTQREIIALAVRQDAESEDTARAAADLVQMLALMLEGRGG